jgi:hypothetical protein
LQFVFLVFEKFSFGLLHLRFLNTAIQILLRLEQHLFVPATLSASALDSARSDVEQPGPVTEPSQTDTLPHRQPFNRRRGVPESDVAGDQPPAHSTRSKL